MESSELNFNEIGSGDNILLLLHAYPANSEMFSKLENFLPENWKAILPDFPGFGNSSIYDSKDTMTMKYLAERVQKILPSEFNTLVIGGVSMGGYVSMAFEELFSDITDGYILMNTRDTADADQGAGRKEVVKKIQLGERENYIKNLIPKLLGKTSIANRLLVEEVVAMIQTTSDQAIIQTSRGMGVRPDRSDIMAEMNKPVLLITGDEDEITGPEIMSGMRERYRNVSYMVIPEAGHYAVFEQPELVSKQIATFLSKF